jgi:hypothetical protein
MGAVPGTGMTHFGVIRVSGTAESDASPDYQTCQRETPRHDLCDELFCIDWITSHAWHGSTMTGSAPIRLASEAGANKIQRLREIFSSHTLVCEACEQPETAPTSYGPLATFVP